MIFLVVSRKKPIFAAKVERLKFKIMALAISGIPMLTGDEALAFRERAEETLKKRGSIDFSKQRAEMKAILAKAKF